MRAAGEIGEHPIGIPNNLMPYIQQVQSLTLAQAKPWLQC